MLASLGLRPYHPSTTKITGLEPSAEETALQALESFGSVQTSSRYGNNTNPMCCIMEMDCGEESRNATYHIHQEDGIEICSNFLAGRCYQGALCPRHHTALPYTWQLRERRTHTWQCVGEGGQEMLERLYSDPKINLVKAKLRSHNRVLIYFFSMDVALCPEYDRIRRLSTSSCPNIMFCTIIKFYFESDVSQWTEYSPEFTRSIEESLREGSHIVFCNNRHFQYCLDLNKLYQENLQTGTKRRIRVRPVFRSLTMMMSELWTISKIGIPTYVKPFHPDAGVIYPPTWHITNTYLVHERVSLPCDDPEYQRVYSYFYKTIPEAKYVILSIYRIQNYFQWEQYASKRKYMTQRLLKTEYHHVERHLFHGTDPSLVDAICTQNFDTRVSSRNGRVFGEGCYFAKEARHSHDFSIANTFGHRFMFLVKVLVGRSTLGKARFRRPPPLDPNDPASLLYDSCVNRLHNPDIFIIFDNDQFYPYFLIQYQKVQNGVSLDLCAPQLPEGSLSDTK